VPVAKSHRAALEAGVSAELFEEERDPGSVALLQEIETPLHLEPACVRNHATISSESESWIITIA
jgi:hypothetical protein